MMELMVVHPHIFWLSLGGLLLAAEMLGGNGYLLWSGVAAVITGLVVWLVPLGWEWQGVMFAILTLLAAWLWWKWLSRRVREQKHSDSHLKPARAAADWPTFCAGISTGQRARSYARR
ncbi:nodulation efficiency family protein [Escherichia coli]|uniref:Nodulation efficiency family protein n=1 Tax=Escherichia coli TaxID=562 RepID=A0A376W189_ECOLX|nr:nodulation efficiency family protein [Escherichia coli]